MIKACVIMPAFNEAEAIGAVINKIRKQNLEVVVIDDGSKDKTSSVAKSCGAVLLSNVKNLGKGKSLIKGFKFALANGFDAVITMDADGQHLPEDIPVFIRASSRPASAILVGNRMKKIKTMPCLRILTNRFMSWFISQITGQDIPDTQCGFRLIKKEVLEKLKLETSRYDTESELLIKAARLGFKIESVPVETVYLGDKSYINPFIDTLRFVKLAIRELWTTPF